MAKEYEGKDTVVLGVSFDNAASHRRFREKECLPFDLLVDADGEICRMYQVPVTNLLLVKLAGRVTYVIGKDGAIRSVYGDVKPAGHAAEIISAM